MDCRSHRAATFNQFMHIISSTRQASRHAVLPASEMCAFQPTHTGGKQCTDRQGARIFKKGHLIKSFHPSRKPIQTETEKKQ
jgi:hypothetical protein